MNTKKFKCSKCKKNKVISSFYTLNKKPNSWCKQCFKNDHRNKYTPKSGANDNPRKCIWCGNIYIPKLRSKSIFCSRNCKDKYRKKELKVDLLNSKIERECIGCKKVIPRTARVDKKYCSEECSSRLRGHTMNLQRRIRTTEPISNFFRIDIYERDKWICQLCNKKVNPDLYFPDPKCASLDHIIPLSRGGSHKTSNVQLSHLHCNTSRGNRVDNLLPRPSLIIKKKKVFTPTEAARIIGVSNSVLVWAISTKKVPTLQREKFGTRYLSERVVNDLVITGVPGSWQWRRNKSIK